MSSFKYLGLVLFVGILGSCQPSRDNPVATAPGMQEMFTPDELADLNSILLYFEGQICQLAEEGATPEECYTAFRQHIKGAEPGTDYLPLEFEAQRALLGRLHNGTQATFWNQQLVKRDDNPNGSVRTLVYQAQGKLVDFMERLGQDYILVAQYVKGFRAVHTISPMMEQEILNTMHLFNLQDIRVRVFLALHFVTVNDSYKRKSNPPATILTDTEG